MSNNIFFKKWRREHTQITTDAILQGQLFKRINKVLFRTPGATVFLFLFALFFIFEIQLPSTMRYIKSWLKTKQAYWIEDDSNNETTAWTCSYVLIISQLLSCDLKAVTTRARVMEDTLCIVPHHVLNLNLIVICAHRESSARNDHGRGRDRIVTVWHPLLQIYHHHVWQSRLLRSLRSSYSRLTA